MLNLAGFKDFDAAEFRTVASLVQDLDYQKDDGEQQLVESVRRILHTSR